MPFTVSAATTEPAADTASTDEEGVVVTYDTGNAIDDILDSNRYRGAISSISTITNFLDRYFIIAMTIVAFFIISAAMFKNAAAAAYCSNSKFWDKVHEAHLKSEAYSLAGARDYFAQQQFMSTSPAGLRDFVLGILPDMKSFTDFEERDIEPKQYWMKAIPQMIASIMIGVFIYNGYHADTAMVVGDFGAITFERLITSCDPEVVLNKLTNMTGTPKAATDGRTDVKGLAINKVTHKIYSKLISTHNDITEASKKAEMMGKIESVVAQTMPDAYLNDAWKLSSVKGDLTATALGTESLGGGTVEGGGEFGDDGEMAYYRVSYAKSEFINEGDTAINNGTNYVTIQVTWKKVAEKDALGGNSGTVNLRGTPVTIAVSTMESNGTVAPIDLSTLGIKGTGKFVPKDGSADFYCVLDSTGKLQFNKVPTSGMVFVQNSSNQIRMLGANNNLEDVVPTFTFTVGSPSATKN